MASLFCFNKKLIYLPTNETIMKKLLIIFWLGAGIVSAQAQYFDVSINPILTIAGEGDFGGEYSFNENLGIELRLQPYYGHSYALLNYRDFQGKQSGFGEKISLKYYPIPYNGNDGMYVGLYAKNTSKVLTKEYTSDTVPPVSGLIKTDKIKSLDLGVIFGYKRVFSSGFIFEAGFGFGGKLIDKEVITPDPDDPHYFAEPDDDFIIPFAFTGSFSLGYRFGEF